MDNIDSQLSCSWTQFSCPPLKMVAARLKECKKRLGASPSFWLEMRGGVEAEVSLVWMQGRVIEVRQERDVSLRLTDDTHTFTVFGADRAPKGKPCLEQENTNRRHNQFAFIRCLHPGSHHGKYVMAMGIVLSCNPEPVLRAVKITDLSDNPVHQDMWKFEVDDLHKNIRCT